MKARRRHLFIMFSTAGCLLAASLVAVPAAARPEPFTPISFASEAIIGSSDFNAEAVAGAGPAALAHDSKIMTLADAPADLQAAARVSIPATQDARLMPWAPTDGDYLGYSTAVSGDTAVVGAPTEEGGGSVYVYVHQNGEWTQQTKISNPQLGWAGFAYFGSSVAISGDTLAVGAYGHETAYAFTRSGTIWTLEQQLFASDATPDDSFGYSVAISGDTLLVGAPLDDDYGSSSGSGYVFVRSGTTWSQQQKLLSLDAAVADDYFGESVAIDGNTAVIGAAGDDEGGNSAGAAFVFVRSGTTWSQQQKLLAADGTANDALGLAVAVSGDTAVVGAPWDTPSGDFSGSAYVFVRSVTTWSQQAKLTATGGAVDDLFGTSVAISGNLAAVGAPSAGPGSVSLFARSGTSWSGDGELAPAGAAVDDYFGFSVGLSGVLASAGAPFDDERAADSGAAFLFGKTAGSWAQQAKFLPFDGQGGHEFGWSVAIDGDTAVVGARGETTNGLNAGAAYVFVRTGDTWTQQARLFASDGDASDWFGISVAISGDTIVVGADSARNPPIFGPRTGAAYVFTRTGTVWTELQKLIASDGTGDNSFGRSVAVSGTTVLVGAPEVQLPWDDTGAAYVFSRSGHTWSQQDKLVPTLASVDFGTSVSVDGDTALVGAPSDQNDVGWNTGAAYVFTRTGETWVQQDRLLPSGLTEYFGYAVAVSGDIALLGAPLDSSQGSLAGAAFVFTRSGITWSEEAKLHASDGFADDRLGDSVGLWNDVAVVGAKHDDDKGLDSGSAYLFSPAGETWREHAKLLPTDGSSSDGYSHVPVGISADTVVIGVPHMAFNGINSGAAYVFAVPPPPPSLTVNYAGDWVEGLYEAGHRVAVTVTDSDGTVKASANTLTGPIEHLGGQSGFSTRVDDPWTPGRPDILPGDFVHVVVDDVPSEPSGTVQVGGITGEFDFDFNRVSGQLTAPWLSSWVSIQCWVEASPGSVVTDTANPDSGFYTCDFDDIGWTLTQEDTVWVQYPEPDGDQVINVFQLDPDVAIIKYTNGEDYNADLLIDVGEAVTWTYQVSNTGNITLYNLAVSDDNGTPSVPADDLTATCPQSHLLVGEEMACTASGVALPGFYQNLGTVTGKDQAVDSDVSATDTSTYFGSLPGIALDKHTNGIDADVEPGPSVTAGETVAWTYLVVNGGNIALSSITVGDDDGTPGVPPDDFFAACPATTLQPGASMSCTASGTAQVGQYANTATVSGFATATGEEVTASDTSHYLGVASQPAPEPPTVLPAALVPHDVGLVTGDNWQLRDHTNGAVRTITFGVAGDVPIMGDWNCNGIETPALFRQTKPPGEPNLPEGLAYYINDNNPGVRVGAFRFILGNPGDIPLAGDFNGDGCDSLSVYRPSEQRFYIAPKLPPPIPLNQPLQSFNADISYIFGVAGDVPFVGDFDGDGVETVGLHRQSGEGAGKVYYLNTHPEGASPPADADYVYGDPEDQLVAGDWVIVDGKWSPALYRSSVAKFFFRDDNAPGFKPAAADLSFGTVGSTAIPVSGEMGLFVGP